MYEGICIGEVGAVEIGGLFDPLGVWDRVAGFVTGQDPTNNPTNPTLVSGADNSTDAAAKLRVNVSDSLYLRDAPNGQIIGSLSPGQIVTWLGDVSGDWAKIQTADGKIGWAASKDPNGTKKYLIPADAPYTPSPTATAIASPSPQDAAQGMGVKEWIVLGLVAVGTVGGISYALSK